MDLQLDSKIAFYQVPAQDGDTFAVQCAVGTTAYVDLPSGYYVCWSADAVAPEHFRWTYLPRPDGAAAPTIAPWVIPVAATHDQVSGVPAGATGGGMRPVLAGVPFVLLVRDHARLAILYSAAGPVTLFCSKVY